MLTALRAAPATAAELAARTRLHPGQVARVLDRLAAFRVAAPLTESLAHPRGAGRRGCPRRRTAEHDYGGG